MRINRKKKLGINRSYQTGFKKTYNCLCSQQIDSFNLQQKRRAKPLGIGVNFKEDPVNSLVRCKTKYHPEGGNIQYSLSHF